MFRFYDKDNSGELDFEEFCEAIRKQARISAEEIPDDGLQIIFDDVDADGGGTVDILEFVEWLDPDTNTGEASVRLRAIELSQQVRSFSRERVVHRYGCLMCEQLQFRNRWRKNQSDGSWCTIQSSFATMQLTKHGRTKSPNRRKFVNYTKIAWLRWRDLKLCAAKSNTS